MGSGPTSQTSQPRVLLEAHNLQVSGATPEAGTKRGQRLARKAQVGSAINGSRLRSVLVWMECGEKVHL